MAVCPDYDIEQTDPSVFFDGSSIHWKRHYIGWAIAGGCAVLATVISFRLLYKHARNYNKPQEQRHIMRIVLLVPIYAIISFLSYRFYKSAIYYETIRDCYEAFVIYSFFILLLEYLGDDSASRKARIPKSNEPRKLLFPLNCYYYNPQSELFIHKMKYGVLQYVVVNPITTIVAVILEADGLYCDTTYSFAFGKIYITIINFISVSVAMYCLLLFYVTIKDEIAEKKPFLKFLCVKLVIFFVFWQTIVLSALGHFNIFKATEYWSIDNIEIGISALLICVEMVFFAILHAYSFSYKDYVDIVHTPVRKSLRDGFNPMDMIYEIGWACTDTARIIMGKPLPIRDGHLSGAVKRANTVRAKKPLTNRKGSGSASESPSTLNGFDDPSLEAGSKFSNPIAQPLLSHHERNQYEMTPPIYSPAQIQQQQQQQLQFQQQQQQQQHQLQQQHQQQYLSSPADNTYQY